MSIASAALHQPAFFLSLQLTSQPLLCLSAEDVGTAVGDTEGSGARGFYASTVAGRIFIFITFCYLVSQKFVEQQLILLAVLNLVSAVSMYYSLQR